MKKITILIADDHTLVRETWSVLLNADPRFRVVGSCGTGEEAIQLAREQKPRLVIMDVSLPGINGIEATEKIGKVSPFSRVLGISLHTQPGFAKQMMQKGAMGYLTKSSTKDEMFMAIGEIVAGRKYVCSEIRHIISQQMSGREVNKAAVNELSEREIEVISYLKKGLNSREIGDKLKIAAKTVEVHRHNILRKLHLKNTAALVNYININPPGLK